MFMSLLWIGYYKIVKLWHYDIHYFVRQWLTITDECVPEIKSFKSGIQLNKWEFLVTCCKLFIFSLQLNSNIFFCSWFTTVFETVLLFCFVRIFHFLCIWRTIIIMLGMFIIVCRFYESFTQTIFNKQCFILYQCIFLFSFE